MIEIVHFVQLIDGTYSHVVKANKMQVSLLLSKHQSNKSAHRLNHVKVKLIRPC